MKTILFLGLILTGCVTSELNNRAVAGVEDYEQFARAECGGVVYEIQNALINTSI